MPVDSHILETAAELVGRAQHRAISLRTELEELEKRKAALENELQTAESMAQRLAVFKCHNGSDYQCPRCWLEEESLSHLTLKKGGGWRDDFFLCELCTLEIKVADH